MERQKKNRKSIDEKGGEQAEKARPIIQLRMKTKPISIFVSV